MSVDESTTAKTVRVRIPVAIDEEGNWNVDAWGYSDGQPQDVSESDLIDGLPDNKVFAQVRYVVADIPVAQSDIPGEVE